MSYLEIAEQALARIREAQLFATGNEINELNEKRVRAGDPTEIIRLRLHLAELRERIDKGFEVLRAREEAKNIAHPYPLWPETWEKLLREYEQTADKIAALTRCPIGDCQLMGNCNSVPEECPLAGRPEHE